MIKPFVVLSAIVFWLTVAPASAADPEPSPTPVTTFEIGASHENLSSGTGDWQSTYVSAVHKFSPLEAVYATATQESRFGRGDSSYLLGVYVPPSAHTSLNAEFGYSPTHQVLARDSFALTLDHRLEGGWGYALGVQHRGYDSADVSFGTFTLDRYWKAFHASYSFFGTRLSGASGLSVGHGASFTHYYGADGESSLTFGLNAGREVENVGSRILVTAVSGASISGVHWFAGNLGFAWSISSTRQGALYTRSGGQLGVRTRL